MIYEKVVAMKDEIPALEKVFVMDAEGENSMAELERLGKANPVKSIKPDPSDIAVLIYTSGHYRQSERGPPFPWQFYE